MDERFYSRPPERLRRVVADDAAQAYVEAGHFCTRFVKVGGHTPPRYEALDCSLGRFAFFHDPARQHGVRPLVAMTDDARRSLK